MKTTDRPLQAIPTLYKGIQLKSRMEAQVALLLDTLGWKWQYEPFSIMLPNGTAYTPDFLIEGHRFIIECRGYESDKGERQIDGFAGLVTARTGDYERYLVIREGQAQVTEWGGRTTNGSVAFCARCRMWFIGEQDAPKCPYCSDLSFDEMTIESRQGQLLILGRIPSQHWEVSFGIKATYDRWMRTALVAVISAGGHGELASAVEDLCSVNKKALELHGPPLSAADKSIVDAAWLIISRAKEELG